MNQSLMLMVVFRPEMDKIASFDGGRVHLKFLASCRTKLSTQVNGNPALITYKSPKFQSP